MLVPMVLSRREKAWWYATIATVASVIGGLSGYAIGYYLYDAVGLPILKFYGREHALDSFMTFVHEYGVLPAVELHDRQPDGIIKIIADRIAEKSADDRRDRCDRRVPEGLLPPAEHHRHEHNVGRD